jgi:phosphatidylserine decarboxylase
MRVPIAREGYSFIVIGAVLTLGPWALGWERVAAIFFVLTVFIICFFRDPERKTDAEKGDIISPADGRVLSVEEVEKVPYLEGTCQRVCIFMSVFNVHVNRIPRSGNVEAIRYQPGRFLMGFSEKASLENEQNAVRIKDEQGKEIVMVQIAGLLARRIVCYLKEGQKVNRGERFGLIRFGSRVDLYLPKSAEVLVVPGDRVKAGIHKVARL